MARVSQPQKLHWLLGNHIGLGARGYHCRPAYIRAAAAKLRKAGMDILACTPEKLAECMAQIIRG